ncbi:hypothetical protein GCM10028775_26680 [Catellatospora paridis]
MRVGDGGEHPRGHHLGRRAQLAVHAGHHDVEAAEQLVGLVQRPVVEDVDLDAGQQAEAVAVTGVEAFDLGQLLLQALCGEAAGDGEAGRRR